MRLGLKDNLEFEGYNVERAEHGEEGLNKILDNKNDLIILDVMMPKVSGFDVCKNARKSGVTTPIILLTAKEIEIDKMLELELSADDYVTKLLSFFLIACIILNVQKLLQLFSRPEVNFLRKFFLYHFLNNLV